MTAITGLASPKSVNGVSSRGRSKLGANTMARLLGVILFSAENLVTLNKQLLQNMKKSTEQGMSVPYSDSASGHAINDAESLEPIAEHAPNSPFAHPLETLRDLNFECKMNRSKIKK